MGELGHLCILPGSLLLLSSAHLLCLVSLSLRLPSLVPDQGLTPSEGDLASAGVGIPRRICIFVLAFHIWEVRT